MCTDSTDLQTTSLNLLFLFRPHLYMRTTTGSGSRSGHYLFLNFQPELRCFPVYTSIGRRGFSCLRVSFPCGDDFYLPTTGFSGLRVDTDARRIVEMRGSAWKESMGAASSGDGLVTFEEGVGGVAEHGVEIV